MLELRYCNLDVLLILCYSLSFLTIFQLGCDNGDRIGCVIFHCINDIVGEMNDFTFQNFFTRHVQNGLKMDISMNLFGFCCSNK